MLKALRYTAISFAAVILLMGSGNISAANSKPKDVADTGSKNIEIFKAKYKGKISGLSIKMTRTLTQTGDNQYVFSSMAKNLFSHIDEISKFSITNNIVQVHNWGYNRSIVGVETTESINYNWKNLTAQYKHGKHPEKNHKHPLTPGLLDPSLYQLFLQADTALKNDKLEYSFVKRGRIENYVFTRLDNESISVGKKKYDAIVVTREDPDNNTKKKTKAWIIPELNYQIGKIKHIDKKGSVYQIQLTGYKSNAVKLTDFYKKVAQQPPKKQ